MQKKLTSYQEQYGNLTKKLMGRRDRRILCLDKIDDLDVQERIEKK